jgi:2-succinyl-5-enolpyruvyl-6-hydroxy-3-cyclohexene-1-carboxylate synthase
MRAANPSHALATTIVDELARAGVEHACISPGSRSAPLAMAFDEHPGIRVRVVLDERSAGFVALGIARASGRPAAVVTTSGTAAANLHPAVVEAHYGRVPMIALTADRPPELRDTGAPQTIDQTKLFGDAVRWFADPGPPAEHAGVAAHWRSLAARAVAAAGGPPPGPVHVNLPFREPLVPVGEDWNLELCGRAGAAPWAAVGPPSFAPAEAEVDALAQQVARTERGVVVAGAGEVSPKPVLDLAASAAWPVIAEPTSGLRRGDHAITTYDALLRGESFAAAHRPDLVLRMGKTGISRALEAWLGPHVPQVLIDRHGTWDDPGRAVSRLVHADPAAVCAAVLPRIQARTETSWLRSWLHGERRARAAIDEILDEEEAPSEPRTARDLAAALPQDSVLVVAASMPVRDLDWFMNRRPGLRVIANRGVNGIDGFVSTTLGVALARRGPVAGLAGDLSMLHDQNGLLSARGDVDATFVVLNNDGGGVFSFLPQSAWPDHFERLFGTPQGVDFAALAGLHGLGYERLRRAADLGRALERFLRAGAVNLIEVRTDRDDNVALHQRLWAAVERALGASDV